MNLNSLIKGYQSLVSLGADEKTSKNELKKIKLFNGFCFVWHILTLLMLIELPFEKNENKAITLWVCAIMFLMLVLMQYINYKKGYRIARLLFIFTIIALTFVFSNFTYKSSLLEYYFLFAPTIALIFFDSKKINYSILIVSFLLFFFPNHHFENYPPDQFNDISVAFLYFGVFIMIIYFKSLNIKNEKSLQQKTKELEDLNTAQSQFFTNVSHEIRTPLTLIKGQIEELKEIQNENSKLIPIQNELNIQVNKIGDMVDDVLDIAKMESGLFALSFSDIDLFELVNKVFHSFESALKQKDISYTLKKSSRSYIVTGDQFKLEKALNNILSNALKFTEIGGEVHVALKRKKNEIIISVSDTGIGISEDDKIKIFGKFYQADNDINKAGGTGIGLSFSKEIIELHKGRLHLKSKIGEGSEFEIFLPLKEVKTKERKRSLNRPKAKVYDETLVSENSISKDVIFLIIDDNREMRKHITKYLKQYECIEAENGVEALHILKNRKIDFIIVDYMMPKMNGKEFIQSARAQRYYIPLIMLTARADFESRQEVFGLGIDDYITKPFNKDELIVRVHNALNNYRNRTNFVNKKKIGREELKENNNWIKKVELFIEKECSDPKLNQKDISENFNMSTSTLSRRIQSVTGQKPKEFIKEIKLQRARKLIEDNPHMSLKELALSVGYSHSYNFSEIYFKRFGNRPWNDES